MTVYTNRFGIQWNYQPHDTGWGTAFNYLHRAVSALLHLYIISDAVDVAPTSPSEDESYFVPSTATGTWSTQHNKLAVYQGGAWQYYTLAPGVRAYIANRGGFLWWTGSLWSVEAAGGSGGFVQTVAGHSPDLAGNVALVVADVAGAAPLSSPPLTGIPTAPTAAALTRDTQLATTAYTDNAISAMGAINTISAGTGITVVHSGTVYTISLTSTYATISDVNAAVAALVNSAPGTMDTLGEIATLLASDESTAAALATTVGGKVSKAGDTMAGDLHLSAPAGSDNSDKAVPSAWVRTFVASLGFGTGSGTVTSVAMSVPGVLYDIGGTPITASGTLALTLKTQVKNTVLAGPTTGADATPTMRALVAADLPSSGVVAGSYAAADITVDAAGRVTAATAGSVSTGSPALTAPSPVMIAGKGWYAPPSFAAKTDISPGTGAIFAVPIMIPNAVSPIAIGLNVSALSSGSNYRFGIYTNKADDFYPDALVPNSDPGTITGVSGLTSGTLSSCSLGAGTIYWLAVMNSTAFPTITGFGNSAVYATWYGMATSIVNQGVATQPGVSATQSFGAMPSTFPTTGKSVNVSTPLLAIKL